MARISIPVTELAPGDQFVVNGKVAYTVITWPDVFGVKRECRVEVRFADGGTSTRVWDEGELITISRPTKTLSGPDYTTDENGENPRDVYTGDPLEL